MSDKFHPVLICLLFMASGCEQKVALVSLNQDGSGTIRIRYAFDEMAGANPANPPEPSDPEELADEARETVEGMAARMGKITFVSGKPIKNAKGWPGYEGVYSFMNINQVKVSFVDSEDGESVADMEMPLAPGYSFKYVPGGKLEIAAETKEADEEFSAAKIGGAKWLMMKGVFNGARETVLVKLDGPVRETNADFLAGKNKDTILLFDFEFDKIADQSVLDKVEAMRRGKGPGASLNLPGARMQYPGKKVSVSF